MSEQYGDLMNKADLAALLGVKESWITAEVAAGRIPHLRLGKRKFIRFRRADIDSWLDSREYHPNGS